MELLALQKIRFLVNATSGERKILAERALGSAAAGEFAKSKELLRILAELFAAERDEVCLSAAVKALRYLGEKEKEFQPARKDKAISRCGGASAPCERASPCSSGMDWTPIAAFLASLAGGAAATFLTAPSVSVPSAAQATAFPQSISFLPAIAADSAPSCSNSIDWTRISAFLASLAGGAAATVATTPSVSVPGAAKTPALSQSIPFLPAMVADPTLAHPTPAASVSISTPPPQSPPDRNAASNTTPNFSAAVLDVLTAMLRSGTPDNAHKPEESHNSPSRESSIPASILEKAVTRTASDDKRPMSKTAASHAKSTGPRQTKHNDPSCVPNAKMGTSNATSSAVEVSTSTTAISAAELAAEKSTESYAVKSSETNPEQKEEKTDPAGKCQ